MKVKIIRTETAEEVDALIKKREILKLPSIQDNWRFNFGKELKKLKNATGFILVTEETPNIIEGCMIFQLIDKKEPYLAMVEVAPHNKKNVRKFERVAGCLIAYAFKLSVIYGVGDFRSMLQLDILEERKEDEIKLMTLYSSAYNAKRWGDTTMVIMDEDGDALIEKYLPET
jgi:hypothetical protein